jgi:hypothetical protein
MTVLFNNNGGFDTSFSVQWNGGQTDRTPVITAGTSTTIDMSKYNVPNGASCWARAYIVAGPNHDSGDNFNYNPNGSQVTYSIDGATVNPSFSCDNCN